MKGGLQPDGSWLLVEEPVDYAKGEKFYSEDQPRDERGRWTDEGGSGDGGGPRHMETVSGAHTPSKTPPPQWMTDILGTDGAAPGAPKDWMSGGSFPVMENREGHRTDGCNSNVVRALMALPPEHLDGLSFVRIETLQHENALAAYDENTQVLSILADDRYLDKNNPLYDPMHDDLVAKNLRETPIADRLNHEVGHHVHGCKLTEEAEKEWASISRNGARRLNERARQNEGEHFAEAYRYFHESRPHLREALRENDHVVYKFMERLDRDPSMLLPKGRLVPGDQRSGRYIGKYAPPAPPPKTTPHLPDPYFGAQRGEKFYSEDQPRDDHGRWVEEGGEGAETGVNMEVATEAALPGFSHFGLVNFDTAISEVKSEILDAAIPLNHIDRITSIRFEPRTNNPGYKVLGSYDPDHDESIVLNSDLLNEVTTNGTVLHEIGHHVYMGKLDDDAVREWEIISDGGKRASISARAQVNAAEHFAEAYRAYYMGDRQPLVEGYPELARMTPGQREILKNMEPDAYRFMDRLAKGEFKLLPRGRSYDTRKQYGRYDKMLRDALIKEGQI